MEYVRRNLLPMLVGIAAILVSVAAVVVIVDRVRGDGEPERVLRIGALQVDLDELEQAFEELDIGEPGELRNLISAFDLEQLLASFREGGRGLGLSAGPVLGVTVEEEGGAVVVGRVLPATPAQRAGVEAGDELLRVEDRDIDGIEGLREALAELEPGRSYELVVRRDGERLILDVERRAFVADHAGEMLRGLLRDRPRAFAAPASPEARPRDLPPERRFSGQPVAPVAPQLGVSAVDSPQGVRVARVQPGGAAEGAGLRPGDVIVSVEGGRVGSINALRERLSEFDPGETVRVTVRRDGEQQQLRLRLSAPAERVERGPSFGVPPGARERPEAGAVLERLADLVAERLAAHGAAPAGSAEAPAPQPEASAPAAELTAYFGRLAAIDDGSVTLTGSEGPITLELTAETVRLGFKAAAVGDLVTVVTLDGVVQMLIVVG